MNETEKQTISSILSSSGIYVGPTSGVSMEPMLRTHRDTVVIQKKENRLSVYDVALYMRGDAYVLHRVIRVTDTGYIIRGDNTYEDEIVPEETVIGVLTEFFRKDEHFYCTDEKYLKYVRKRVKSYPVRRVWAKTKNFVKRVLKKLGFRRKVKDSEK